MRYLILLGIELVGVFMIVYAERIVKLVGRQAWAEKAFGAAGTYTAWRLYGIIAIIGGLVAIRYGYI